MNLGHAIKLGRVQRGLTQTELATWAGLSSGYVSLLERNQRDPVFSTIENIAHALDIPLLTLFFLASDDTELAYLDGNIREILSYETLVLMRPYHD